MECLQISSDLIINTPYVLITYTTGFGKVPIEVDKFLEKNHKYLLGVAASGNMNWGTSFAKSANIISEKYGVPIICKFELSGTEKDIENFLEGLRRIERH